MAFTIPSKAAATALLSLLAGHSMAASLGLPTRDQNPLLQAFFLPSINMQFEDGLHLSHALFITNTFQQESRGSEQLVIDVENYRYDLSLAYQQDNWRFSSTLPFITNDRGRLDGLIEDWHDFFGLPEGKRPENPDYQINLSYLRDGETFFEQSKPDSDIGDLSLSAQYLVTHTDRGAIELGFGIELPTGSIESNSGNEKLDTAFWATAVRQLTEQSRIYGLAGITFPGKGGPLKDSVQDRIWLSQLGSEYDFNHYFRGIIQFDLHTAALRNTRLDAFGESLQMQLSLQINNWMDDYAIDLFFSEDIHVKSAPDITFGLRVSHAAF